MEEKDAQDLQNCKRIAFDPSNLSLVECGNVCRQLENPSYARIYLCTLVDMAKPMRQAPPPFSKFRADC
jgi:hypothetical protein